MKEVTDVEEYIGVYENDELVEATREWVHVVTLDVGEAYSWEELVGFFDPRSKRFYWASGSGCSCDSLSDDVHAVSDFEEGDRDALRRAVKRFADQCYRPAAEVAPKRLAAVQAVKAFVA